MESEGYCIFGGRFQPFHVGHLAAIQHLADSTSWQIVIGIVNPDPLELWRGDGRGWHRFDRKDNPLNYWERLACIQKCVGCGPLGQRVEAVVPLPRPSVNLARASRFLPPKPRIFALCPLPGDEVESWKGDAYRGQGESVHHINISALPAFTALASGRVLRALIAVGNPAWELLVPETIVPHLHSIGFPSRVAASMTEENGSKVLREFCETHPAGKLAAELFGLSEEVNASDLRATIDTARTRIRRERLRAALQNPTRDTGDEIACLVDPPEREELETLLSRLLRTRERITVPAFREVVSGLIEVVLAKPARDRIVAELARLDEEGA